MFETLIDQSYWEAVFRISGPLAIAALAALLCSRAGILYVGIEGVMLTSAFFSIAAVSWTGSIMLGVVAGVAAGMATSVVLAGLSIGLRMGDVVGGLVIHVGAIGLCGFLVGEWFPLGATIGSSRLSAPWHVNGWLAVPFGQSVLFYLGIVIMLILPWFLRTPVGLRVRVSGESLAVARSLGVRLVELRYAVHAVAGAITGLAGTIMGLAIFGTFSVNIVSGRGFIALACVVLGAWRPWAIVASAFLFGAADALAFHGEFGAREWTQMLPYVLVLVTLAMAWGQGRGPAEEGRPIWEESA